MNKDLIFLYNLINANLYAQAPVLVYGDKKSGNLKSHIKIASVEEHKIKIVISAPFYDVSWWQLTGEHKYTGGWKKNPEYTDYALFLNNKGAFGKGNKSKHWTNRAIFQVCDAYAKKSGGSCKNKLPLD